MLTKEEERKIFFDNYKKIESLIDVQVSNLQKAYSYQWYEAMIEDKTYNFLIKKLVELRQGATEMWGIDWVKQFPKGIYEESKI